MQKEEIDILVLTEVERAKAKHPDFPSSHHGFAIIKEEKEELEAELGELHTYFNELWNSIKSDNTRVQKQKLKELQTIATRLINESVQVAATIQRFDQYLNQ